MRPLNGIGCASVAVMQFFGCQLGGHGHSFCHAHILHYLTGFDITLHPGEGVS
jgi:hypothetical protein